MTDTPRTKAELLALFANNTTHDISPQDMRDFVVSLPDLAADELFMIRDVAGNVQMADTYLLTYPAGTFDAATVVGNQDVLIPDLSGVWPDQGSLREFVDPSGWVLDTPFVSSWWETTFPANTLLLLPPGRYSWMQRVTFAKAAGGPLVDLDANWVYFSIETADAPNDRTGPLGGNLYQYSLSSGIPQPAFVRDTFPSVIAGNKYSPGARGDFSIGADDGAARVLPAVTFGVEASVHLETWELHLRRVA